MLKANQLPNLALRLGVLYLMAGMGLGMYMGMKEDFSLHDAHAHLNLLGYVSTFLIGLFLKAFPNAVKEKLMYFSVLAVFATVPLMLISLLLFTMGNDAFGPVLGLTSMAVFAAYILFAIAVFRATKK